MAKYYAVLILFSLGVLYYVFLEDPCNRQLRTDFLEKYPGYTLVDSASLQGSPLEVQCSVYYRKPDDKQVYQDVWSYKKSGSDWRFSRVLQSRRAEQGSLSYR